MRPGRVLELFFLPMPLYRKTHPDTPSTAPSKRRISNISTRIGAVTVGDHECHTAFIQQCYDTEHHRQDEKHFGLQWSRKNNVTEQWNPEEERLKVCNSHTINIHCIISTKNRDGLRLIKYPCMEDQAHILE
jgi:hypothetical protein